MVALRNPFTSRVADVPIRHRRRAVAAPVDRHDGILTYIPLKDSKSKSLAASSPSVAPTQRRASRHDSTALGTSIEDAAARWRRLTGEDRAPRGSSASTSDENAAAARWGRIAGYALPANQTTLHMSLKGQIGKEITAREVHQRIACNPHVRRILIKLDSPGGDLRTAQRIYDILRAAAATHSHISGRVTGECSSAAILILLAADWREAVPSAKFYFHGSASSAPDPHRWTWEAHAAQAELVRKADAALIDTLVARCGGPRWRYERLVEMEETINAYDARSRYLLITAIVPKGS